jgi:hypothetical protein
MYREKSLGKVWVGYGFNFKQASVGISIDRFHISIDLLFFFVAVELPVRK